MIRERIESLGPYPSLFLLAIPTAFVESLKLVALAGDGHWISGSCMVIAAYATSFLVLERLFLVVKPKIMTLGWFARIWHWLFSLRLVKWIIAKKRAIRHRVTDIG